MDLTLTRPDLDNRQLKTQWENLKQINATQKEKNAWKKINLLETDSNKGTNPWRLMTNGEIEEYLS